MSGYAKCFDENKYMNFLLKMKNLENIQYKKDNLKIQKGFDSEPMYNEEHSKTKINSSQR